LIDEAPAGARIARHEAQETVVDAEGGDRREDSDVEQKFAVATEILDSEQAHEDDGADEDQPTIQQARQRDDRGSAA